MITIIGITTGPDGTLRRSPAALKHPHAFPLNIPVPVPTEMENFWDSLDRATCAMDAKEISDD